VVAPTPGAVVVVRFPFSDLSQTKLRPAVVLADAAGSLRVSSYARPGKLFTASRDLMLAQVGKLKPEPFRQIIDSVVSLLSAGGSQ